MENAARAVDIFALMIFFWLLTGKGIAVAMEELELSNLMPPSFVRDLTGDHSRGGAFPKVDRQRTPRKITTESEDNIGQSSSDGSSSTLAVVRSTPWDKLYQNAVAWDIRDDSMFGEIIALSSKFVAGCAGLGCWGRFVWLLQHWIIYRSWYLHYDQGSESREFSRIFGRGFITQRVQRTKWYNFCCISPQDEDPPDGGDSIEIGHHHVVPLKVFLLRLVAVQKTLDEYWVIDGCSPNDYILRYLKDGIESNIRNAVLGRLSDHRGDVAQVVSRTARIVYGVLSIAGKYRRELQHDKCSTHRLEQIGAFREISDSLGVLVRLARTATDWQLAMKVMGTVVRWLEEDATVSPVSLRGLKGLKHLYLILLISFDVNFMETSVLDEWLLAQGRPRLEQLELSSSHYKKLLTYVEMLFNGTLQGLMPVDLSLMNEHFADEHHIDIHTLPDGRPGVLTSEIVRASLFSGVEGQAIGSGERLSDLNKRLLFELLCSPAGESEDAFKLLHQLRELGDNWVGNQDEQYLVDAHDALDTFFEKDENGVGELVEPEKLLRTHSAPALLTTHREESIRPVYTVAALMADMHTHFPPALPATAMEGKP